MYKILVYFITINPMVMQKSFVKQSCGKIFNVILYKK